MVFLTLAAVAVFCRIAPQRSVAQPRNLMDPSLTELGYIPLPDLGMGTYTRDGHTELGGLYPNGSPIRPPQVETAATEIAAKQIQPLDARGEPDCYEAGFSIRWMTDKQMQGDPQLNWNPRKGTVKAPLILWGPYFWCDGLKPRSDGLVWTCCEPNSDVYNNPHPEASGAQKGADQIYAFFKTDPTATPWYLRKTVQGKAPEVTAKADVTEGRAPLTVHFSAEATDADGKVVEYVWTFGDGTFSYNPNGGPDKEPFYLNPSPVKTFCNPGVYTAYLTVTDDDGNAATRQIRVTVTGAAPIPATMGPSRRSAPNPPQAHFQPVAPAVAASRWLP